ncbi:hypothetical protein Emed_005956 [Eimeria media]
MSLAVQAQIRRNAEEVRAYLDDLRCWEQSFDDKGKNKEAAERHVPCESKSQPNEIQEIQSPPQQQHDEQKSEERTASLSQTLEINQSSESKPLASEAPKADSAENRKKYARDLNSLPDYYKAWDAYDPDAEEPVETEQSSKPPQSENSAHPLKESSATSKVVQGSRVRICTSAKPLSLDLGGQNTSMQESYVIEELKAFKSRGNAAFATGRYKAALESYTEALKLAADSGKQSAPVVAELTGQIYGNRAAAHYHLKNYTKCISDCTEALEINPQNLKVLHRRGLAWAGKGDTEKAIEDLQDALKSLNDGEGSHTMQKPPSHGVSTSGESAKIEQEKDQACPGSSPIAATDSPDCKASERSILRNKIAQDLSRIWGEVEGKKREKGQARKAALLQPLKDSEGRSSKETLRPLEVKVII